MNMNRKGYTLIELIAVVTIMGILTTIAIPNVLKYINKSRATSFDTMLKSAYEASENYMMDTNMVLSTNSGKNQLTIPAKDLVEGGYLESLRDPVGNTTNCEDSSSIKVTRVADSIGGLPNYKYEVTIECPSTTRKHTYPSDNLLEATFSAAKRYMEMNGNLGFTTGSVSVSLKTLQDEKLISDINKIIENDKCSDYSESKVVVTYLKNSYKYDVTIKCMSGTRTGVYAK